VQKENISIFPKNYISVKILSSLQSFIEKNNVHMHITAIEMDYKHLSTVQIACSGWNFSRPSEGKKKEEIIPYLLSLLTGMIQNSLESGKIAVCAFLDISGAFDNTSPVAIGSELQEVEKAITNCMTSEKL